MSDLRKAEQIAVEQLFNWQKGGTSFSSRLFDLMCKADTNNFNKLASVYKMEACALIAWRASSDPKKFFEMYGLRAA